MAPGLKRPNVSKETARNAKTGQLWSAKQFWRLSASQRDAAWPGERSAEHMHEAERVDEGDVREHMAESRAQVAVKVPACLWAVGRAGCKTGVPPLTTGGEAQSADKLSQCHHGGFARDR
jgi:hypothetical protein